MYTIYYDSNEVIIIAGDLLHEAGKERALFAFIPAIVHGADVGSGVA